MNDRTRPIDRLEDIPAGLSDEEEMRFLQEHGVSKEFLENAEVASEDERPRPRTRPINIRFDDFTLRRLKALAASRNVGYQTLLKTFVQERLYEEEKREGALSIAGVVGPRSDAATSKEAPGKASRRINDWLNRVHDYVREHEKLLDDPELTSIATSRVASDSAAMLKQLSEEIKAASRKQGYPVSKLNRMEKAFHKLEPFVVRVIDTYKVRFGMDEEDSEEEYDIIREAERIIETS
jgi:predicted DNA binding CopG/RHH family protein